MEYVDRLKLIRDTMYEAITEGKMNYFQARDSVIRYVEKIRDSKVSLDGIQKLPAAAVTKLNEAGFLQHDVLAFQDIHRINNHELRRISKMLMQHKVNDVPLTIYEAEQEIRNVIAGKPPAYRLAEDYQQNLEQLGIHPIDLAHVFEDCHKAAIHALLTQLNVPMDDAIREVVIKPNDLLMIYPKIKTLIIVEVTQFLVQGKGNITDAQNHIDALVSAREPAITEAERSIAKINSRFVKFIFDDKFKKEVIMQASVKISETATEELEEYYPPSTTASILPGLGVRLGSLPLIEHAVTPAKDTYVLDWQPSSHLPPTSFNMMLNHIANNTIPYSMGGVVIIGLLYCTGAFNYLNPLPALAKASSSLWNKKKTKEYSSKELLLGLMGKKNPDTSGSDDEDPEQQHNRDPMSVLRQSDTLSRKRLS